MYSSIVCIGAAMIDELYYSNENVVAETSNPASAIKAPGGVARNIAHHLALLKIPVQLITVLGNDAEGAWLQQDCIKNNIGIDYILKEDIATGKYVSILQPDGALFAAVCDESATALMVPSFLQSIETFLSEAKAIVADANLKTETLMWLAQFSKRHAIPLIFEPVSVSKAKKLSSLDWSGVMMVTPNEDELWSLSASNHTDSNQIIQELLDKGLQQIWLRKGAAGSAIFTSSSTNHLATKQIKIKDSTGAGDAALAGWLFGFYHQQDLITCMQYGHTLAMETLQTHGAIHTSITKDSLMELRKKYYNDAP